MIVRVKRPVEITVNGKTMIVERYIPDDHVCSLEGCIRKTTAQQRGSARRKKSSGVYCCMKHERKGRKQNG